MDVGDTVAEPFRNDGYSLGLMHPYIYGHDLQSWLVWCRHCGLVAFVAEAGMHGERKAERECYRLNGLRNETTAEMRAAMDDTP